MRLTSVQDFLKLTEKSTLLSPEQLADVRTWPEEEPQTLAARMVNAGWLTKWQSQQLLAGKGQFSLGRYRLLDQIGQGGMGAVYKAVQPSIGRTVALKVMNKQVLKQANSVSRFLREIRSAAVLDHPNIVRAYDADCDRDVYFLVMEFVTGRNLKSWINLEESLSVGWSCECIRQAALGLQHAFEQGMVHRDIKPSNLLVTQCENGGMPLVKILDLGLARFVSETQDEGDLTRSGQVLGTPDYMAPEQARNTKTADIRADIFSLGCALFELLTGRLPFPGNNVMEKLMARATDDAPPMRMYRPDIPAALDAVVARMLARDPQLRYGTPVEVAQALAPFAIGTAGAEAPRPAVNRKQAGFSTQDPAAIPLAASDVNTEGALHGFPADLTLPTSARASRPVRERSEIWQQPQVRVAAGVLGGVVVLGLIWGIFLRPKETPTTATANPTHPRKKHMEEAAEETLDPPQETAAEHDPEREIALWVLQKGGTVVVAADPPHGAHNKKKTSKEEQPARTEWHAVRESNDLPAGHWSIIEVSLHGNLRLGKSDFARLANLTHLETLSLADTRFADADLIELRNLESLIRLELQDTPLTDAGIGALKRLPNLQSLQLSRTRVSGAALDALSSMRSLTELSLEGTQVADRDLRDLEKMPQLVALNLAGTRVKGQGLSNLKRLKELTSLDLGGLPMQGNGLSHLKGMINLRYLRLTGSRVTDADLMHLSGMTNLKELLLRSTGVSGAGLKHLTWMAELENLDLQDTVVGDDGFKVLKEMSTLKSLNLQGSVVSDAGIDHLRGLRLLEFLDLSGTKVTRQGVESLQAALSNCKIKY